MCSEEHGTMLTDDTYIELSKADLAAQMDAANVTEAWIGRYFTPWSWLKGCYTYTDDRLPDRAVHLKFNQQSTCIEYCHDSNYFGLKGSTCYCFQKIEGQFVRTDAYCISICPGNKEERCGGNNAMTVYMNDLCFNNSTLWNGTISTSRSGKTCRSWNASMSQSFPNESVDNTDYFCRDPTNKGNTWCYTGNGPEDCDVPKCLGTTDNNGAFGCMAFRKISGSKILAQQTRCSLKYKAVCKYPVPITCGETYNEDKRGKFSFPNTTRTYDSNHNCVWKIMATPPEKIEIYIEFDLEDSVVCMCDKIKIYDNDAPKGQANKTVCGRGNFTFISSGPAVVIQFISDESVNGTGFNVSWKVEKEKPTTIRSITTVFNTQTSHTGYEVWLIVVISSGTVVFVLLITVLICCSRRHKRPREEIKDGHVFTNTVFDSNEIITTVDKMHGSPIPTDSNRLDKNIETYETVPSELSSAESITQPQRAAIISPNDDDDYNSMNATLNSTFASQTDNVYNHITKDETEYSVSVGSKSTPTKTHIKRPDNVYNTLHKTEEKLYDHADLSGKPDKRTENQSDETYNQLPRTPDYEYDSTCLHTRVADDCEYNYIVK